MKIRPQLRNIVELITVELLYGYVAVFLLLCLIPVKSSADDNTIAMAIIEGGKIDYANPLIANNLDLELMSRLQMPDSNGIYKNVYALERWETPNSSLYRTWQKFYDALLQPQSSEQVSLLKKFILSASSTLTKYKLQKNGSEASELDRSAHKTSVASILVAGLKNVRLVSLGMGRTLFEDDSIEELVNQKIITQDLERRHLSDILKSNQIRVINFSFKTVSSMHNDLPIVAKKINENISSEELERLRLQLIRSTIRSWKFLLESNPQAVFVFAAGNEGMHLENDFFYDFVRNSANGILVGASTKNKSIANFSNRSSHLVQIAALGVDVVSARVGGGKMLVSGTSFAAPAVSRSLAQIFMKQPTLTGEEALEILLHEQTESIPGLSQSIEDGRLLKSCTEQLVGQ